MSSKAQRRLIVVAVSLAVVLGLLGSGLLGSDDQAQASVLVRMSDDQLAHSAATIVAGQVTDMQAREASWGGPGGAPGNIETVVQLRVIKALKGASESPGDMMTVVVPGGTVGDLTLVVDSAPVFRVGETAMLYLDDLGRVIGGHQGKRALSILEAALYGATPNDTALGSPG